MADLDSVDLDTLRHDRTRARMQLAALLQTRRDDVRDWEAERRRLMRKITAYEVAITREEQEQR